MSNIGTGFIGFQTTIDMISESLGERTRAAVAHQMVQLLGYEMSCRRGDSYKSFYAASGSDWTTALPVDFDAAVTRSLDLFTRIKPAASATAEWKGHKLSHRGSEIVIESHDYNMVIARFTSRLERGRSGEVMRWQVNLDDEGLRCLSGKDSTFVSGNSPTMVHVRSEESAHKGLRAIVERFFNISFVEV